MKTSWTQALYYGTKIGRKIAFILKIYQSTEAELQENIKCCTCWDKVALENTWETNPCVGK